jgi:putative flippase GtrA
LLKFFFALRIYLICNTIVSMPPSAEKETSELPATLLKCVIPFCIVGATGVLVDMSVLYLCSGKHGLGLPAPIGKICSFEAALLNNFIWNDVWTFRDRKDLDGPTARLGRLLRYNGVYLGGLILAVLTVGVLHSRLGWSLYQANLLAVAGGVIWNFLASYYFAWTVPSPRGMGTNSSRARKRKPAAARCLGAVGLGDNKHYVLPASPGAK